MLGGAAGSGWNSKFDDTSPVAPLSRPVPSTSQVTEPRIVPSSAEGSITPVPTVRSRRPPPSKTISPSSRNVVCPVIVTWVS